jgi:hypothetical protein
MRVMMNKINYVFIAAVLVLTGCKSSEDLETSVNNRWKAVIENDLEKAYQYFSPGYKEIENLLSYRNRIATAKINMNWKEAQFKSANCETEDLCKVQVSVAYSYTFPRRSMGTTESVSTTIENWINIDGDWYLVPKDN